MACNGFSFVSPITRIVAFSPAPNICSKRRKSLPGYRRPLTRCTWEERLVPEKSSERKLHHLQTASSTTVTTITPHAVTKTHLHALDANSDLTIALPFVSSDERNVLLDTLSLTHFLPPQSTIPPRSAAVITTSVPQSLRAFLGLDVAACNELAAHIAFDGRVNRAVALRETLSTCGVKTLACVVSEAEGMGHEMPVKATAFLTWTDDEHQVSEVQLPTTVAVALAAICEVPCYAKKSLLQAVGRPLEARVDTETANEEKVALKREPQVADLKAWELLAEDVLNMKREVLLQTIRRCGISAKSEDTREQLLKRLVVEMCEVQRREVGIALAAEQGRYDIAAELQKSRSERGALFARMRDLEREGRLSEAATVAERLRDMEAGMQDVSLEPGSYDARLDRDEWYRPTR